MKRIVVLAFGLAIGLSACATPIIKEYKPLPKTKLLKIESLNYYEDENFSKLAKDEEITSIFRKSLEKKIEEAGFLTSDNSSNLLRLKTSLYKTLVFSPLHLFIPFRYLKLKIQIYNKDGEELMMAQYASQSGISWSWEGTSDYLANWVTQLLKEKLLD